MARPIPELAPVINARLPSAMPFTGMINLARNMSHQLRLAKFDHFTLSLKRVTDDAIVQRHVLRKQGFFRVEAGGAAKMIARKTKATQAY